MRSVFWKKLNWSFGRYLIQADASKTEGYHHPLALETPIKE